jgi:hypothetical protein
MLIYIDVITSNHKVDVSLSLISAGLLAKLKLSLASPDNYKNSTLEGHKKPSLDIRAFLSHRTVFDPIVRCVTCTIEIGSLNGFLPSFRLLTCSAATVSASHLRMHEVRV